MDSSLFIKGITKKRRNVKPELFNGKRIDNEIVRELLEVANWAPTHKRTEPWRFIVYEYEKTKDFGVLHSNVYKEHTPADKFLIKKYNKILNRADNASHVIVAYVHPDANSTIPLQEEIAAAACAVQNMLLLATAYEIASYWGSGGMCYHPAMNEALGIDSNDVILGWIFLGRTDDFDKLRPIRNTPIDNKVRWV